MPGFGVENGASGQISRNTNNTVQVAEMVDADGKILEMATHGEACETQEEMYVVGGAAFVNEAVNGQSGDEVVTAHNLVESNTDFAKVSITKRKVPTVA